MNFNKINVIKRDGTKEKINLDKIHKVLTWSAQGLDNVSISQVELNSQIQFYDGIKTEDIHELTIKACADLISEETPNYQYMASRLAIFHLRKIAFGKFEPPSLYTHVSSLVKQGLYDPLLLTEYTIDDYDYLETVINHNRDLNFSYVAVKQLEGKYLLQDRTTKRVFESPQFLYILIAMCLFAKYKKNRLKIIKDFYNAISEFKISLPTPIMSGVRTLQRQFSSCVLIECADSLDSINAVSSAIVKYVSQKAGIGINAGAIRALGSPIRGGQAVHTGCIPFYKLFCSAVKSCSQGGVRGGAATLFYPIWHLEVLDLIVLKNNRGTEENRIRHLDYSVQISKLFYQRLIKGENITLFSPHNVKGLFEAFFADQELFENLYLKYEKDKKIPKKQVKAIELFSLILSERANTGRIYIQNVDHCNTHSAFNTQVAPIKQSNLCMEITLPTKPLTDEDKSKGEIALCTLSAINLGALNSLDEIENLANLSVRALDELLDYQNYPVESAYKGTLSRRSLGIGVINYAYYLAKNNLKYTDKKALNLTHLTFEAFQYYLLKASCALAKEKGSCAWFKDTTYAQGLLPIDTYKKDVDSLCNETLNYDWEILRSDIKKYGLRNSTLSSLMPSETSSQIANATNGIEPPRGFVSVKQSKDGILKQVVPEIENLKDNYQLLWDLPNNNAYINHVAIMQKFIDQSISANTSYDPKKFPNDKVPMKVLMTDLLRCYKFGLKTLYYHNTRDGANIDDSCTSGACKI